MRYSALLVALLLVAGLGISEAQHRKKAVGKEVQKLEQLGTDDKPVAVKIVPSGDIKEAARLQKEEKDAKRKSDEELALYTKQLAAYTNDLSSYTKWLVVLGSVQALIFIAHLVVFGYQGTQLKRTVETTVFDSMPVLSPLVVNAQGLHPTTANGDYVNFTSTVHFVFENFGKTPGMIRELRADLFLTENDELPAIEFAKLPLMDYSPIIAGDSRRENALMGAAEYEKQFTLSSTQFAELLAEAAPPTVFRRFHLIGQVLYDDFFGYGHTRRFCVKLRRMGDQGQLFQIIRGGQAFNQLSREKAGTKASAGTA